MNGLRVVPLGGLGEIGLNLLVLETPDAAVAVDCGVMFPDEQMLGVDVVIPDVSYLRSIRDRFRGIFLTHGHEDHIGALPYVLSEFDVPVYGTPLTLGFVRERLREHGLSRDLRPLAPGQVASAGPFAVDPFVMTHSIPDAVGLAVRTPFGTVVHTGDFKIDQTPLDGRLPDLARLAALGEEGVLLLLSDSTNVEHAGVTPSERTVGAYLDTLFAEAKGRIVVTTFSSHIHRMQQAIDLSARHGRKVAFVGRSLLAHTAVARELGLLHVRDDQLIDLADARSVRPHELTLITAGSQAEAASALVRIAMDAHKQVRLEPGDTVILSSRVIPGNERAIANLVNHLYRRGAIVHYGHGAPIHVSGHASQEELKLVLNLVRPRYFVPVHGEYRQLVRHNLLAAEVGVRPAHCHLLEDGDVLEIDAHGAHRAGQVPAGRVFVDGKGIGDVHDIVLRDRRHLSEGGFVLAVIGLAQHSGELVAGPELMTRGVTGEETGTEVMEGARAEVLAALDAMDPESRTDAAEVQNEIRRALRRHFRRLDRRPVILPFVIEM
ncbi:MAG TPA: ribonuclease J [Candidatus Limnocylindria bacterium]|nr:ribonuclease J [Candidatus Limnocylindria bacterium]